MQIFSASLACYNDEVYDTSFWARFLNFIQNQVRMCFAPVTHELLTSYPRVALKINILFTLINELPRVTVKK